MKGVKFKKTKEVNKNISKAVKASWTLERRARQSVLSTGNTYTRGRLRPPEERQRIKDNHAKYWTGKKRSIVDKKKMSDSRGGSAIKIDSREYQRIHYWIMSRYGKANKCEICFDTNAPRYDWSNISFEYKKDINDWRQLCRKCHINLDIKKKLDKVERGQNGYNTTI